MAIILTIPNSPSTKILDEVCHCTSKGGVLAVATESFYALAGSALSSVAVERVAELKGRSSDKPLLVLIGGREQLSLLTASIPPLAVPLMDQFWPGPLTIIFPARRDLPKNLTSKTGTIGIRCPGYKRLQSILCATGPLTGTSANRSGMPPLSTAQDVLDEFGDEIDLILDSGASPGGSPSTILSLVGNPRILRTGPIDSEAIQTVIAKQGITLTDRADE